VNENPSVSIIRKRSVGDGFHEDVTLINHDARALELELRLEAGSDFADLFEVKDALTKRGRAYGALEGRRARGRLPRGRLCRETRISVSQEAELDEGASRSGCTRAQTEWSTCIVGSR